MNECLQSLSPNKWEEFPLTSQYNARIKRKRRKAKVLRKKDRVHAAIEKAKK